jgi:mono/diheme cytochrome c family protein
VKLTSLVVPFAVCSVLAVAAAIAPAMVAAEPAAASGRRVFSQSCSACHDALSTATRSGPGLKNYYRHQPRPTDGSVRAIIQQGKGKMPAFSTLNQSQVNDLVAYLKTL